MIKKISISGFAVIASLILLSAINKPNSSGAPSASTGAPGEQTCAMSSCHDDNNVNSGTAKLSIEVPENMSIGETSVIKVKIEDMGKVRFGFQVTALDDENKKVGEFIITDSVRTQVLGGNSSYPDREYLTYTYYGTMDKAGSIEWQAKWKPTAKGKVTFYVAGLSSNNNGEDKGDYVFTTTKSVTVSQSAKTDKISYSKEIDFTITKTKLSIINPYFNYIKTISLTDVNGKSLLSKTLNSANAKSEITLPEINAGIVIATIETASGTITKKLFITHD